MKHLLPLISVSDSDNYSTPKRVRHLNDLAKVRTVCLQEHTHTGFISGGPGGAFAPPFSLYVIWGLSPPPLRVVFTPS